MSSGWKRWSLAAGVAMVFGLPGIASASEMDVLLRKLVEKGVLTATDAQEIHTEVTRELASQGTPAGNPLTASTKEPASNWKWSGDIRLREEYRNGTGSGNDVNRQRIRFRVGLEGKVTEDLKVGARLATGASTDPIATNQSFNTSFNRVNFLLDRAYVEYTPELAGLDEVKLDGGIIPNPFWYVGELVWDDDLNFDGAALHLAKTIGPASLFANGGVFSLQTDITEAASLWSIQGGASARPFKGSSSEVLDHLNVTGAIAYHDYKNVTNPLSESTALTTAGGLKGNTSGIRDINILNPTFEIASQVRGVPVRTFVDWVHNTAVSQDNNGFQVGFSVGKAKTPWSLKDGWEGGYFFERLEPDATFGAFTYSDFGGGGTNHFGHVWWLKLATMKHSNIAAKYFTAQEVAGIKNHEDRLQVDWNTSF